MTNSNQHRATPEQWAHLERGAQADRPYNSARCLLELRDRLTTAEQRIQELEAGTTCPHIISTDEGTSYCGLAEQGANLSAGLTGSPWPADVGPLLWVLWHHQGSKSPVGQAIRKYLGMGQFESMSDRQIGVANQYQELLPHSSVPQPAPAGGLVERVYSCIVGEPEYGHMQARAAILAVAEWLDQRALDYSARRLREEVERHG